MHTTVRHETCFCIENMFVSMNEAKQDKPCFRVRFDTEVARTWTQPDSRLQGHENTFCRTRYSSSCTCLHLTRLIYSWCTPSGSLHPKDHENWHQRQIFFTWVEIMNGLHNVWTHFYLELLFVMATKYTYYGQQQSEHGECCNGPWVICFTFTEVECRSEIYLNSIGIAPFRQFIVW